MRLAALGSMVLIIATTWPRWAPAMMPLGPRITSSVWAVVSTMETVRADWRATSAGVAAALAPRATSAATLALVDVVDDERVAGLQQVRRHAGAHGAEPDEADGVWHGALPISCPSLRPPRLIPAVYAAGSGYVTPSRHASPAGAPRRARRAGVLQRQGGRAGAKPAGSRIAAPGAASGNAVREGVGRICQSACKPGSVWRGFSATAIPLGRGSLRASCNQPGRRRGSRWMPRLPRASVPPLFGLAPGGVCRAASVAGGAVRSYRTVSPLPRGVAPTPAVSSLWHFPWGRPRRPLAATVDPWSPDFPPPGPGPQSPSSPAAAVRPTGRGNKGGNARKVKPSIVR